VFLTGLADNHVKYGCLIPGLNPKRELRNIPQALEAFLRHRFIIFILLTSVLVYLLTACSGGERLTVEPTVTVPVASPTTQASPTPQPSATPLPPRIILWVPAEAELTMAKDIEAALNGLVEEQGLILDVRDEINPEQIGDEVKGVIVIPPDPGVAAFAQSVPSVPVIALGMDGLNPTGNLTTLTGMEGHVDRLGFLAGYLAAVVTPDWRVGVISPADSVQGQAVNLSFTNGVVFFCGLCRPVYPPYNAYPLSINLSNANDEAERDQVVQWLVAQGATTVYVSPDSENPELMGELIDAGIQVIGNSSPVPGLETGWVASVEPDFPAALGLIWEEWLAGGVNQDLENFPVKFSHANPDLFSLGKQGLVSRTLDDLNSSYIGTGVE
jgi:hypothetical protein